MVKICITPASGALCSLTEIQELIELQSNNDFLNPVGKTAKASLLAIKFTNFPFLSSAL